MVLCISLVCNVDILLIWCELRNVRLFMCICWLWFFLIRLIECNRLKLWMFWVCSVFIWKVLIRQMICMWCGNRCFISVIGQDFRVFGSSVWLVQDKVVMFSVQVFGQVSWCMFISCCISLVMVIVGWVLLSWIVICFGRLCRL